MARSKTITFRLDEHTFSQLSIALEKDKPIGVRSEGALARKIVCDFLTGRTRYITKADRLVDLDKYVSTSKNLLNSTKPSHPPSLVWYAKIERIIAEEPGFSKLLNPKKKDIVYQRDGRNIRCSSFVVRVTEMLHKSGINVHSATKRQIIEAAIAFRVSS